MKNFFNIHPKTKEHGFEQFIVCRPDSGLKSRYEELSNTVGKFFKRKVALFSYVSLGIISLLIIFGVILMFLADEETAIIDSAYYNVGRIVAIVGMVAFVLLIIIIGIMTRRFTGRPEVVNLLEEINSVTEKLKEDLRVPSDCAEIDVFCFPTKKYPNVTDMKRSESAFYNFLNLPMWVYKDDKNLYFADVTGVWAVPLHSVISITHVNKYTRFSGWNKEAPYNSPQYKRMVRYNKGTYYVKPRYSVQFNIDNQEWEILIPAYDIEEFSRVSGIS